MLTVKNVLLRREVEQKGHIMDWLHFVGRTYYTREQYVEEALRLGSSRRASSRVLRQVAWGDRIFLAQGDMKRKDRVTPFEGTNILGYFTLTTVGGIPLETLEMIAEDQGFQITNAPIPASASTRRRCGTYLLGPSIKNTTFLVSALPDYEDEDEAPAYLLQGKFTPIEDGPTLVDIGFRWGFRRFDGTQYLANLDSDVLEGQLVDESKRDDSTPRRGTLRVIEDYRQVPVYGPKSRFDI